jgi:beta-RFAP synthase
LAIAAGVRRLFGLALDPRGDAATLDRGARSGIGIGLFESGGAVLDGGRKPGGGPAPIISRVPFPGNWRVLLIQDANARGMNGAAELKAFAELPDFLDATAAHLCRVVLMQAWPALLEEDIASFGNAVTELQRQLGNHFASVQGGRYTSQAVAEIAAMLETAGAHGCGQSSWGPTGFSFAANAEDAERLLRIVSKTAGKIGLTIDVVAGNNEGAVITPGGESS